MGCSWGVHGRVQKGNKAGRDQKEMKEYDNNKFAKLSISPIKLATSETAK